MLAWDPLFVVSKSLVEVCPVWVEFLDLPLWLWSSLSMLAGTLGTLMFVLSNLDLGRDSNKVCISWNSFVPPLDFMDVDLGGLGFLRVGLNFDMFFGAYFHCNMFGHFAKACPQIALGKETIGKEVIGKVSNKDSAP